MLNNKSKILSYLYLNWPLLILMLILSSIGFLMLYSAAQGNIHPWASKQIIRFSVLLPIMIVISVIHLNFWLKHAYTIYGIVLTLLILVEFFGITAMGATRWINIGPINIQPSEIMKISIVFALARYFHCLHSDDVGKILYLFPPLLIVLAPVILTIKQPDLGTALIMLMMSGAIFFVAGVKIWKFAFIGITAAASFPFIWNSLHEYQKKRVLTFLDPEKDPLGDGYNILQSKIAIGSGGVWGKGFLNGSQSQLSFLPEKQTDFIFTMLTEEFGFVGGLIVIILYLLILFQGLFISLHSRSQFGRIMAIGITTMLFLHFFINIAMVMGLIPIVGAPLPLLSYGGTIMVTVLFAFCILLNVNFYNDELLERHIKFIR